MVTVAGRNVDAAAQPVITVTVVVSRFNSTDDDEPTTSYSTVTSEVLRYAMQYSGFYIICVSSRLLFIFTRRHVCCTNVFLHYFSFFSFVFTALHGMQTRSSDENFVCPSVRPSVCLSIAWIVTKQKKNVSRFLYHTKDHLAIVFSEKEWLVGATANT